MFEGLIVGIAMFVCVERGFEFVERFDVLVTDRSVAMIGDVAPVVIAEDVSIDVGTNDENEMRSLTKLGAFFGCGFDCPVADRIFAAGADYERGFIYPYIILDKAAGVVVLLADEAHVCASKLMGRAASGIFEINPVSQRIPLISKPETYGLDIDIGSDLLFGGGLCDGYAFCRSYGTSFSVFGGFLRPSGSEPRSNQSPHANADSDQARDKGPQPPTCRFSSGVCGLPLGAKIALMIILSGGATGVWSFGFWKFLDGRRNAIQLSLDSLLALAMIGFGIFAVAWTG